MWPGPADDPNGVRGTALRHPGPIQLTGVYRALYAVEHTRGAGGSTMHQAMCALLKMDAHLRLLRGVHPAFSQPSRMASRLLKYANRGLDVERNLDELARTRCFDDMEVPLPRANRDISRPRGIWKITVRARGMRRRSAVRLHGPYPVR